MAADELRVITTGRATPRCGLAWRRRAARDDDRPRAGMCDGCAGCVPRWSGWRRWSRWRCRARCRPRIDGPATYRVKQGDTLELIAAEFYGDRGKAVFIAAETS